MKFSSLVQIGMEREREQHSDVLYHIIISLKLVYFLKPKHSAEQYQYT